MTMSFNYTQHFNYALERQEDYLCIDMKSFYASVECVERGLDPLTTLLVVMSNSDSPGGLALATSPRAKKELGLTNVSRRFEIPDHPDLHIVPPRMHLYIEKNIAVNQILQRFVADEDLLIYSIDESFIRITASKKLFGWNAYQFAKNIQQTIFQELGLYCTIGIGDNMLLSKLALDNGAKLQPDMIATWHYQDVPNTVWKIAPMTNFWGINTRTAERLNKMGIRSIYELAHFDFFEMKERMGVIGQQLIAHAWGIDRAFISEKYIPKSKNISNSQILMRDYTKSEEIKRVLREMLEQIATRLRTKKLQTSCLQIGVGVSKNETLPSFSRQVTFTPTNHSADLVREGIALFERYYTRQVVRRLSVSCSQLREEAGIQLNLFESPLKTLDNQQLDTTIDLIRQRYGFDAIIHASSLMEGATAIQRSHLIGGHAGGLDGVPTKKSLLEN
ncbi:Y-family DNA polymerase [Vagococcus lutrae]|nr:Y-family DNA polymerase [Vagococcus lutrae]MCO7151169.1 Y-family DNA polymerase [Vagococcus lutrae]MDT2811351.1 Y-family DNA polymerase [Vagococcus lutrae]MDT2819917.1 Y-family DNA polymerase [Vagococcus lutrae]MDT2844819.1 Y-family DNA polymerase [Vagococcus lutrae]WCG06043.1 Y-family DNA polymerase [Vagococcus lutrae]